MGSSISELRAWLKMVPMFFALLVMLGGLTFVSGCNGNDDDVEAREVEVEREGDGDYEVEVEREP